MIEHLSTVTELPVDAIIIEDRLRDTSPDGIANLVEAIKETGFSGSIRVRRKKDGDYLIDGAHRLAAMKELGRTSIPVDLVRCNDAEARLMEIDGNLMGQPMTVLDDAYFLATRREMIQKIHPEMRQGSAGAAGRWMQLHFSALAQTIATARGIKTRQVYNIMAAGASLSREEYQALKRSPALRLNDLLALRKIVDTEERTYVVEALSDGLVKNAAVARKAYRAARGEAPAPVSDKDQKLLRLLDAWDRAGKRERRAFLEERGAEVAALLSELDHGDAA
jgi:ParB family chromosome partitioning protein